MEPTSLWAQSVSEPLQGPPDAHSSPTSRAGKRQPVCGFLRLRLEQVLAEQPHPGLSGLFPLISAHLFPAPGLLDPCSPRWPSTPTEMFKQHLLTVKSSRKFQLHFKIFSQKPFMRGTCHLYVSFVRFCFVLGIELRALVHAKHDELYH